MQVSVETTEGLGRRMRISVPAERVENEVENRLKDLSRRVKLKGFRPGKIPMKVMVSRYGERVRREVIDDVTRSSFYEALSREQLQLAGRPRFEARVAEAGKDLEYEALFEVMGRIDLAPLEAVEIEKPSAAIAEADVDKMLETLRRQRASWQGVERPAQAGDRLVIDFRGTVAGQPFEGGAAERHALLLGSKQLIPGFEDGLLGAKAGDRLTLELSFPADYRDARLAGQPARFEVTVHEVAEARLPEIDAEFVRGFDVAEGTIEALRREVRKTMQLELDEATLDEVKRQVMDALYRANPITVPETQVDEQIAILMGQTRESLKNQGVPEEKIKLERAQFETPARRRVALGLVIAELVKNNHFVADEDKVRAKVESIAASYDNPDEVLKWYYADRARLANIESLVLEDRVVEWVLGRAAVRERAATFDEIMAKKRGGASAVLP